MSRLSRRQFLHGATCAVGSVLIPSFRGVSRTGAAVHATALDGSCGGTLGDLFDIASTVEALITTIYYHGIRGQFWGRLPQQYRDFLCSCLDGEYAHYQYLVSHGAHLRNRSFVVPSDMFGFDGFPRFLATLESLETLSVSLFLAAVRQLGEGGEPVKAEIMAQILGVDAEHRIAVREMAQSAPPAPNNLCFEPATYDCVAQVVAALNPYLGGGGAGNTVSLPNDADIRAAVGDMRCEPSALAREVSCGETLATMFDMLATAEALGTTFYYYATRGSVFPELRQEQQWYLQAALDEERNHLVFLRGQGASAPPSRFYFPHGAFDDRSLLLDILETMENAFIAAYLATTQQFTRLGEPLLAEIAGQILGVESEHRVLSRVIGGKVPATNLCLERAGFRCLSEAVSALSPFLTAGLGSEPAMLPNQPAIDIAVDRFGCTPVAVARQPPYRTFLPLIVK